MKKERRLRERKDGRSKKDKWLSGRPILVGFFVLLSLTAVSAAQEWPKKAITVNSASSVGGSVDTASRAFAREMSQVLGVPITIINMPGGGGGIAAQNTYLAANDGYTWQAQGGQLRTVGVLGYHDKSPKEWYCMPLVGYTSAIIVRADSPYKTFRDLIEALKKDPDKIPCGAGYRSASWGINYELMKKVTGLGGRYVPYAGSSPTQVALLTGEIQFAVTGIGEHAELLKGGKVRALAHFEDKPYHVKGYGDIPAITDFLPVLKPYFPFPAWASFSLRGDTPKPILKKIDEAALKASQIKSVKEYCENFYCFPMGVVGEEAQKLLIRQASMECWLLFEAGIAKKSPAEFGIPKP